MRVLIIEDEINAYEYLKTTLKKLRPDYRVVGHIDSVEDAINWFINEQAPDLIMLDIQLSDGISLEIFNHVKVETPIIFTTAFDQYAVKAFKLNSIDYLLKPINQEELLAAIEKLESIPQESQNRTDINGLMGSFIKGQRNRCLVKKGNHYEFIGVDDIAYVNSEDSLTFLHTIDKKRHIYTKTIQSLIEELNPQKFFQINRKQIVHIEGIQKIHPFLNQRLLLELNTPHDQQFVVSRAKVAEFKSWIDS